MKSEFHTETINDELAVLLICDNIVVSQEFSQVWEQKHIKVQVCEFKKAEKELLNQSKTWYKIFWFEDIARPREKAELRPILQALKDRRELTYLIMSVPFTTGESTLKSQAEYSQLLYQVIEQRSPYTSLIVSSDLVEETLFSLLQSQCEYLLTNSQVDSSLVFQPLSLHEFVEGLIELSFTPRGGQRRIIQGKKKISFKEILRGVLQKQEFSQVRFRELPTTLVKPMGEWKYTQVPSQPDLKDILSNLQRVHPTPNELVQALQSDIVSIPKPLKASKSSLLDSVEPDRKREKSTITNLEVKTTSQATTPLKPRKAVVIPINKPPEIKRSKLLLHSLEHRESVQESTKKIPTEIKTKAVSSFVQKAHAPQRKPQHTQEIDQKISELFSLVSATQTTPPSVPGGVNKAKKRTLRFPKYLKRLGLVFIPPLVLAGGYIANHLAVLQMSSATARALAIHTTISDAQANRLQLSSQLFLKQTNMYSFLLPETTEENNRFLAVWSERLGYIAKESNVLQLELETALAQVLQKEDGDPFETLEQLTGKVEELYRITGDIEAELKNQLQAQESPDPEKKAIQEHLRQRKKDLLIVQQILNQADELLARGSNATYVILLQDNQEIRPSGGFLQSIALVTFTNGKIGDISYHTADLLDKELQGVLRAPNDVQRYLKEDDLYLHDANWFGDFTQTSDSVTWFIEKATGREVLGVIAMNQTFLQEILKESGSLEINEYSEEITSQNIQEKILNHARETLENTAEKRDFYTSSYARVFEHVLKQEQSSYGTTFQIIRKLFEQAEMQIAFQQPSLQTTFRTLGWTGEIITPPCPAQFAGNDCFVSSFHAIDTNIGVNKVNKSVNKKQEHVISFDPDQTLHKVYLTYENSIKTSTWPGGIFNNYLRIFLQNSTVKSVKINDQIIDLETLDFSTEGDHQIIGIRFAVLPQQISTLELIYVQPPIEVSESFAFFWQRQAGTGNTPLTLTLQSGNRLIPTLVAPEATISSEDIVFRFVGNQHVFAGVKFR